MRQEEDFKQANTVEVLYNDVCSTCNHVQICSSRKNRQGPVWFCEEFDDHVTGTEEKNKGTELQMIPPWKDSNPIEGSIRFKGLCINCENRNTCVKSRVEGGVWHCEEYC